MPFDPEKDKVLKKWQSEETGLVVSINKYGDGEPKIQIGPRMVVRKDGQEVQRRAGRMTFEDLSWFYEIIDEVILLYMRAPHSYTREDVVEIQSHSGSAVLQTILSLVISSGARLAEPGEFTRRAFLNGRIDLSQAEAVADLITAKTEQAMLLATQQLTGGLRQEIHRIRTALETAAGHVEAMIEFPEDLDDETMEPIQQSRFLKKRRQFGISVITEIVLYFLFSFSNLN